MSLTFSSEIGFGTKLQVRAWVFKNLIFYSQKQAFGFISFRIPFWFPARFYILARERRKSSWVFVFTSQSPSYAFRHVVHAAAVRLTAVSLETENAMKTACRLFSPLDNVRNKMSWHLPLKMRVGFGVRDPIFSLARIPGKRKCHSAAWLPRGARRWLQRIYRRDFPREVA